MSLGLRTTGRAKKTVAADFERELASDDLDSLLSERGVAPPQVIHLRERHHALARSIAEGVRPGEAALTHRYSQSRMSILLSDPAFQELVAHYREIVNERFVDLQDKLAELSLDAAHILQARMEETPDDLSDALVLQILQVGADRTGHGPSQKTEVNIKVGLADRLSAGRDRIALARNVTPAEEVE